MLQAKSLSKAYGSHVALHPLDLEVRSGEVLCLLGANGAGKTTTLNLLLGFLEPTAGAAYVDGIEVAKDPAGARARLAYVPEVAALYPHLSSRENFHYFVRLSGAERDPREAESLLAKVGFPTEALDRRAGALSKGMRQKVVLAIALARGAKALLLDEPLSGLDPSAANDFVRTLRAASDEGVAVFMATHDVFRAKDCATRVGILKSGRLAGMLETAGLAGAEIERIYLEHMRG